MANTNATAITIPASVSDYSVTEIGNDAFRNTKLQSVTFELECKVTEIGDNAFWGSQISQIVIPASVVSIGDNAFNGCNDLISITFDKGSNLISIHDYAFSNCQKLMKVELPDGIEYIGESAFYGCLDLSQVKLPNSLSSIDNSTFETCISLTSITIPSNVTSIGESAFQDCTALASIILPTSVESIGSSAFQQCSALTSINLPDNLSTIADETFSGCSELASINIPSSVSSIDASAFEYCTSLEEINIPETSKLEIIDIHAFFCCTSLKKVSFEGINGRERKIKIGEGAFDFCKALENLTLCEGITEFGPYAFKDCKKLKTVSIPGTVILIDKEAFFNCENLETVTIAEGGKLEINDGSFANCTNLQSITCLRSTPPTLGNNVFNNTVINEGGISGTEDLLFYVPDISEYEKVWTESIIGGSHYQFIEFGTFTENDIIYKIVTDTEEKKEVKVVGYTGDPETVIIPSTVSFEDNTYDIISIGKIAFQGCTSLKSIYISEGVETIEFGAFGDCMNLAKVNLPNSLKTIKNSAFYGCVNLPEITIPTNVETIEENSFMYCTSLRSVICLPANPPTFFPKSLCVFFSVINNTMLFYVPNIEKYENAWTKEYFNNPYEFIEFGTLTDNSITVGNLKYEKVENSDPVTMQIIGFEGDNLEVVEIPATIWIYDPESGTVADRQVTAIGRSAFADCSTIKEITIPESITSIGQLAFKGSSLEKIVINANITGINGSAFNSCKNLTDVELNCPNLTLIGNAAFEGCSSLKTITLPENVNSLVGSTFGNSGLESIVIPNANCVANSHDCFAGCENLQIKLGNLIFQVVKHPADGNTPGSVKLIGCAGPADITDLVIPDEILKQYKIAEISEDAFAGLDNLTKITIESKTPPVLDGNPFPENAQVLVPNISEYKKDETWQNIVNIEGFVTITTPAEIPSFSKDETINLSAYIAVGDGSVSWTSSIPKIATVDASGTVNIQFVGKVTITATCGDGSDSFELTVNPKQGDANWDGVVTVADPVNVANYIVKKYDNISNWTPEAWGIPDTWTRDYWQGFYDISSDINGQSITVADASAIVDIILSQPALVSSPTQRIKNSQYVEEAEDALVIDNMSRGNKIPVKLQANSQYVALQADIHTSNGVTLDDVMLGSAAKNHKLTSRKIDDHTTRIVLFDLSNSAFDDSEGDLFEIIVDGNSISADDIEISNIIASDIASNSYELSLVYSAATGIDSIEGDSIAIRPIFNGCAICNAKDMNMIVCTLDGSIVKAGKVVSDYESISLTKGVYVVTVNNQTYKVAVK